MNILAMHIAEGVLSPSILVAGVLITLIGLIKGVRSIDARTVPQVGVMAAALFVASLVHIPVGPTSVHLLLSGLAGLLLGWAVFPALFVAILLQAVLFQFGGLTTLGVNTAVMALPAVVCYSVFGRFVRRDRAGGLAASFLAGSLATLLAGGLVATALYLSDRDYIGLSTLAMISHLALAAVEGTICALCVSFLRTVKPNMLPQRVARIGVSNAA